MEGTDSWLSSACYFQRDVQINQKAPTIAICHITAKAATPAHFNISRVKYHFNLQHHNALLLPCWVLGSQYGGYQGFGSLKLMTHKTKAPMVRIGHLALSR
jgi:hypothetical protein